MLTKVPSHMQVRILHPISEESLPPVHFEIPEKKENPALKIAKKLAHAIGISSVLSLSIYMFMRFLGLELGNVEASVIVLFPALLGLVASFVVF